MNAIPDECKCDKQQEQADEEGKYSGEEDLAGTELLFSQHHVFIHTFSKRCMNSVFLQANFGAGSKFETRVEISKPWMEVK